MLSEIAKNEIWTFLLFLNFDKNSRFWSFLRALIKRPDSDKWDPQNIKYLMPKYLKSSVTHLNRIPELLQGKIYGFIDYY
jgi:hypothetical protein